MYLTQVSRYIHYSVIQLARAMWNPSKTHMGAAKHLLWYLAGSIYFNITHEKERLKLTAFSDANWVNIPDYGKSTASYVMIMFNGPVSFKVGMQGLTTQLTMEAELVSAALAMKEAVHFAGMMVELRFDPHRQQFGSARGREQDL